MGVMLLELDVSNEASIQTRSGDRTTERHQVSSNRLRARLMLSPDDHTELAGLGFVEVTVEAEPTRLKDMTRAETLDFLRDALCKMLRSPPAG